MILLTADGDSNHRVLGGDAWNHHLGTEVTPRG